MTYISPNRFNRIATLPVAMAQTELRRAKSLQVAQWSLQRSQKILVQSLTIQVVKILTTGELPSYSNTSLGVASVGIYLGTTLTSPIAWASVSTVGTVTSNPFSPRTIITPGVYTVIVSNNTYNLDLSVCVTGSLKLYA